MLWALQVDIWTMGSKVGVSWCAAVREIKDSSHHTKTIQAWPLFHVFEISVRWRWFGGEWAHWSWNGKCSSNRGIYFKVGEKSISCSVMLLHVFFQSAKIWTFIKKIRNFKNCHTRAKIVLLRLINFPMQKCLKNKVEQKCDLNDRQ